MLTRRQVLRRGAGAAAALTAGPFLATCAPASAPAATSAPTTAATTAPTLPPPETTSIQLTAAPCDSAIYGAEKYLREEGFTDVVIRDTPTPAALAQGNAHLGNAFPPAFFNTVQGGQKVVALGGLHPGCAEIWAQPGVSSLKDLKGRSIVVRSRVLSELPYSYIAMVLKQEGLDPKDVNFVVQSDANLLQLYLDGKSDAIFLANVTRFKSQPGNKGKLIHSQAMDEPWKSTNCCFIIANDQWVRANPIAAKRAMRAIYRTADTLPADRGDAAKLATDKGLFGGGGGPFDLNVREAANMVPLDWRAYDPEKAVRFYAPLLRDVGLLTASTDDLVKAMDLKIFKELSTELKK